ncbi:MAG: efflux RND transporter permease subunit [Archangium sp.]|nr:efflux RND transporter permease subunit [Archangium sp.]
MWIVLLALRRPYTFVVMALVLLVGGFQVLRQAPTDILPNVDIPVISVVWTYGGLPAQQMEQQITQFSEFSISGNTAGISNVVSETFDGVSVIRVFLHPGTDVASAMAQITAASQTILRRMPPNTIPPIILRYSASSVPIVQLAFTSEVMSEAEVFDHVNNRVRTALSVISGTRFPLPAGGKMRQITVDLAPEALRQYGLSPHDVNLAVASQNLTLPTGSAKVGDREYRFGLNSSPEAITALNDLPIRRADGQIIFLRELAWVHDGFAVQTNIARRDGKRAVVLSVMKTGEASTVAVAKRVRDMLPTLRASAPEGLSIELLADQSTFVTNAIDGLLVEGLIAACLTAAMILVFLGSWRSTLIVAVSIPLSVVAALLLLRAMGHSINAMTLGGLALAVGILVDDATVEIENIHRNLAMGKPLTRAILDGAQQIAVPAFVASLAIGIVFVSVVFLEGPAKFLFLPMGLAVAFSVMASYLLSRTLVPTMVKHLLAAELEHHGAPNTGLFARFHQGFERFFERVRGHYVALLQAALGRPKTVLAGFSALVLGAALLVPFVGRDFFPKIDAGKLRLHVVAPTGTRLEETEVLFAEVERALAELIPASDRELMLDQIGALSGYNLAITDSATVGVNDGEILVVLHDHREKTTADYERLLRQELPKRFPGLSFYFQPADIVTQIMNLGLPSAIDIQISGQRRDATYAAARQLEASLRKVRGLVDVRLHQQVDAPKLQFEVDRARASEVGLTQRDVANNVLLAVSSSGQVSPNYWSDPKTGMSYPVAVQIPEREMSSLDAVMGLSVATSKGPQQLGQLGTLRRQRTSAFQTRVNVQPTFNVRADVQDVDLGAVTGALTALTDEVRKKLPPGSTLTVRGQLESMESAFWSLGLGLLVAALLVYALMVINFQSWLDPFIILTALPGAAVGIVLSLFVTQTTFSIPSLMGAVMSIGVATANSILVVTFANSVRPDGLSSVEAALEAGRVRLRPVMMTAMAMALGMLPMSLGLSEGGEQNAALGRAVLGGLTGATVATLFLVPIIYSVLRRTAHQQVTDPDLMDPPLGLQREPA